MLASNNVFDATGQQGTSRTLHEIHRLLRPDGVPMFTSHNRDKNGAAHWPRLEFLRNPVTQVLLAGHWCRALVNHIRLRRLQMFAEDYAILNDQAHDCALLHYYIGSNAQRRQLDGQGSELLDILDCLGDSVAPGNLAERSRRLLYVARRIPVS